ncbi:MAG: hypothetical protein NT043_05950 [Candidatus Bathyarchaeota archaeon]|nr:hypothetical protein [Candidatus Bathyarchaeota archaeon]
MTLTIKFIGALRHLSGKTQLTINFQEGMSLKELVTKISQQMPKLEKTFSDQQLNDSRSNGSRTQRFKIKLADTCQR